MQRASQSETPRTVVAQSGLYLPFQLSATLTQSGSDAWGDYKNEEIFLFCCLYPLGFSGTVPCSIFQHLRISYFGRFPKYKLEVERLIKGLGVACFTVRNNTCSLGWGRQQARSLLFRVSRISIPGQVGANTENAKRHRACSK